MISSVVLRRFQQSYRTLSSIMSHNIKTFVFIDMETTGLPREENNTTRMTEVCFVSVLAKHLELGVFPRVNNKLTLCLNPEKMINPIASDITGLSNELLQDQPTFTSDTVELLKRWLEVCQKPLCFVAHNGDYFDFPILRTEIEKTGNYLADGIFSLDSILAFKAIESQPIPVPKKAIIPMEFDDGFDEILVKIAEEYERKHERKSSQVLNETTPKKQTVKTALSQNHTRNISTSFFLTSYKLQDIYTRLTNKRIEGAHEAEGDVLMLITCAAHYAEKFVAYANSHARRFIDIPPMKPGKRLGV